MKYTIKAVLIAVSASFLCLNGCGNKGPLYLPDSSNQSNEEAITKD